MKNGKKNSNFKGTKIEEKLRNQDLRLVWEQNGIIFILMSINWEIHLKFWRKKHLTFWTKIIWHLSEVHPSKTSINWGFPNNGKIKELSGTSVDISLFHSASKQQYRVQRNNRTRLMTRSQLWLKLIFETFLLWTKLILCQFDLLEHINHSR